MTARGRAGRGGQGGHEPRSRILARAARVLELAAAGRRQTEIAAALGITQAAVSKILSRALDRQADAYRVARHREHERLRLQLDYIYREGLDAWHRSQEERTTRRQRKVIRANGEHGGTVVELESVSPHGDPRCLQTSLKALQHVRALIGPTASATRADDPRGRYADLTDAALEALIARQERLLRDLEPGKPETSDPVDRVVEHTGAAETPEPECDDPAS